MGCRLGEWDEQRWNAAPRGKDVNPRNRAVPLTAGRSDRKGLTGDEAYDVAEQTGDEQQRSQGQAEKSKPVDLGCGTGQTTRLLAPHFQEVVGIDVSETQLEQARAVLSCPNITYRKGTAEDLPFPDGSVDLITASSAAHYFDESKFMAEANRVLKPGGCIALMDFCLQKMRLHYQDCGERLTDILQEMLEVCVDSQSSRSLYLAFYPEGKKPSG
ncbi:hypothetical protein D4764_01G0003470 [Takifugu flavidus]|uniref:Methyltransferase type 11 domain-containing protein n=1 Tax=Takifugu flavidus TaxID=433684 RepID=A0A5C6PL42_9TELE|nr:hypothetical protein D4764_01G0003470 [Takifugu flavidus]